MRPVQLGAPQLQGSGSPSGSSSICGAGGAVGVAAAWARRGVRACRDGRGGALPSGQARQRGPARGGGGGSGRACALAQCTQKRGPCVAARARVQPRRASPRACAHACRRASPCSGMPPPPPPLCHAAQRCRCTSCLQARPRAAAGVCVCVGGGRLPLAVWQPLEEAGRERQAAGGRGRGALQAARPLSQACAQPQRPSPGRQAARGQPTSRASHPARESCSTARQPACQPASRPDTQPGIGRQRASHPPTHSPTHPCVCPGAPV